jgi:hypothetical protein
MFKRGWEEGDGVLYKMNAFKSAKFYVEKFHMMKMVTI